METLSAPALKYRAAYIQGRIVPPLGICKFPDTAANGQGHKHLL